MVGFSSNIYYGNATMNGSSLDATAYKDPKYAQAFYKALLDPEAETIRRKSGAKYPKRQHVLIYDAVSVRVRSKDVTNEMTLSTPVKSITSPEQWVIAMKPVLNARKTFHAQASFPAPVMEKPANIPMTMKQKRKQTCVANIEGKRQHNNHRDW